MRRDIKGIQSVEIGARLLDVLAAAHGPMSLRDLSAAAGMSASKARRYLVSLLRCGLAKQETETSHYELGAMALRLGLAALHRRNVVRIATERLIALTREVDATVLLTIWGDHGPTIVAWYEGSEILICSYNVGSVLPVLRTAPGRIFLAYLPRRVTERKVREELSSVLNNRPGSKMRSEADVIKTINEIRKRRLAVTREELVPGLTALAAPVFDHQGRLVAALAMLGSHAIMGESDESSPAMRLRRAADEVSISLGFQLTEPGSSLAEWLEGAASQDGADAHAEPPAMANARGAQRKGRAREKTSMSAARR